MVLSKEEIKQAWDISNLQWLKFKDNCSKGNKLLMVKIK